MLDNFVLVFLICSMNEFSPFSVDVYFVSVRQQKFSIDNRKNHLSSVFCFSRVGRQKFPNSTLHNYFFYLKIVLLLI